MSAGRFWLDDHLRTLRHRIANGLTAGRAGLTDRILAAWYPITDRVAARRLRLADRIPERRRRLADRILPVWYRLTDGSVADWKRLTDRVSIARGRLADAFFRLRRVRWRRTFIIGSVLVLLALPPIALIYASALTSEGVVATDTRAGVADDPVVGADGPPRADPPAPEDGVPGFEVHEGAGYLFSYPDTWQIGGSGDTTTLRGPLGNVVMTIAMAPPGSLQEASESIVDEIAGRYREVELVARKHERTAQGLPSLAVGGHAVDETGDPIRFLVITIQGAQDNRAIEVVFAADANPLDSLAAIQQIAASFRISPTA